MRKRFRFALGTVVQHREDPRHRSRVAVRRYLHEPPKDDVYWLDKPINGTSYFHGRELQRAIVAPKEED